MKEKIEMSEKEVRYDSAMLQIGELVDASLTDDVKNYIEELKWKISEWEKINTNLMTRLESVTEAK